MSEYIDNETKQYIISMLSILIRELQDVQKFERDRIAVYFEQIQQALTGEAAS